MKIRPILFSGPMVRAILEGKKSQTRRVIAKLYDGAWCLDPDDDPADVQKLVEACPYGQSGDRLWVRETWMNDGADIQRQLMAEGKVPVRCLYRANPEHEKQIGKSFKWTPSIFMPRWASRITLEVLTVRVERLTDISKADICAEMGAPGPEVEGPYLRDYYNAFSALWESINGKRGFGWIENPWVWVIEFKQVQP